MGKKTMQKDSPEKGFCVENTQRCFLILSLTWSLFIFLLLCWGLWLELNDKDVASLVAGLIHSWKWIISLGFIWLTVLFFIGLGLKGMTSIIRALRRTNSKLASNERESAFCQAKFEAIVNSITDAVVFTDEHSRIVMTNPAFHEMTRYAFHEVQGKEAACLFTSPDAISKTREGGGQAVSELECRLKDGSILMTETIGTNVRNTEGEVIGFLLVLRNISQRKMIEAERSKLELKLRQAHKTEAIGTLAGGIAHDFNNILGIIFVNLEIALEDIPEGNPARTNIQRISHAATRARKLVKQLLAYSRQKDNKLIPLMPGPLMKESLKQLFSTTPASITIVQNINDESETIMMDPLQLKEVLFNLFSNAVQAIGGRGRVEVSGKVVDLAENLCFEGKKAKPGRYFMLSVGDDGVGMDNQTMERMFDPFFTTREVGKGTGLGLASVMGIVRSHDGYISVNSKPGSGTIVQVYFPVVDQEREHDNWDESLRGNERVLFVDDEEHLVEMAGIFLERCGFSVTERTDGREAVEAFRARPDDFDVIVTDFAMPNLSGSEVASQVLGIRPDIPVILISGHDNKISREEVERLGIREFLRKPFDGKTLVKTIRKALEGEHHSPHGLL